MIGTRPCGVLPWVLELGGRAALNPGGISRHPVACLSCFPPCLPCLPCPAQQGSNPSAVTRETVASLLDGATPLHCAAIRGNPAQVDHLLLCGADPLLPNAAGECGRLGGYE